MAEKQKIRITFRRIRLLPGAERVGAAEFIFDAAVNYQPFGDKSTVNKFARMGVWINLPAGKWSREFEVDAYKPKKPFMVEFNLQEKFSKKRLGGFRHRLKPRWTAQKHTIGNKYYQLEWEMEVMILGSYTRRRGDALFACRQGDGCKTVTTVSGLIKNVRFEIHPVGNPMSLVDLDAPNRPRFLRYQDMYAPRRRTRFRANSPLNEIWNPPVIPLLSAAEANAGTAARVRVTNYWPRSLRLTDDDTRLVWKQKPLIGEARVEFVGKPNGLQVLVRGTHPGHLLLILTYRGMEVATFRAYVRPMRTITCRVNIVSGQKQDSHPNSRPADVLKHLAAANVLLRQAALELVLDRSPLCSKDAEHTETDGIFTVRAERGKTVNVLLDQAKPATLLNHRPDVLNIAYIKSFIGNAYAGLATDCPGNEAGSSIRDAGTPSSSWHKPSGIRPDKPAKKLTMKLLGDKPRSGYPDLFGFLISDGIGPPSDTTAYGWTIAHELGHVFDLCHRVDGGGSDGLKHPKLRNLMKGTIGSLALHIDLLQARAIDFSVVVRRYSKKS